MQQLVIKLALLKAFYNLLTATIGVWRDAEPDWGYDDHNGTDVWGDICPAYSLCKDGQSQSPIDLPKPSPDVPLITPHFDYQPTTLDSFHDYRNALFNYDAGSFLEVDGARYELKQFHFHTPAEHTIEGYVYPMELHLVHRNEAGTIAVIGIFIQQGEVDNPAFLPFWQHIPSAGTMVKARQTTFRADNLLPENHGCVHYNGSLTTPPCTEGVNWFVMMQPIFLSAAQIEAFRRVVPFNTRPPQPLNGRVIHSE